MEEVQLVGLVVVRGVRAVGGDARAGNRCVGGGGVCTRGQRGAQRLTLRSGTRYIGFCVISSLTNRL